MATKKEQIDVMSALASDQDAISTVTAVRSRISEIAERRKLVSAELATIKSTLKELNKDADDAKRETFRLAMAK